MKYIELYIKSIKKKSTQPKVAALAHPLNYNLPGLKSYSQMKAEEVIKFKREFNYVLEIHRRYMKRTNIKGEAKKELNSAILSNKDHMESLLQKIGSYTPSEKANGFEVPNAQ